MIIRKFERMKSFCYLLIFFFYHSGFGFALHVMGKEGFCRLILSGILRDSMDKKRKQERGELVASLAKESPFTCQSLTFKH